MWAPTVLFQERAVDVFKRVRTHVRRLARWILRRVSVSDRDFSLLEAVA